MRRCVVLAVVVATSSAHAERDDSPDALTLQKIVYAHKNALYKSDARGRNDDKLVDLPAGAGAVRALRTDAAGKILAVDLGATWYWMPLDGSAKELSKLPCGDGPLQVAADGTNVICRSAKVPAQSVFVRLSDGKVWQLKGIPTQGARIIGSYPARKLIWADAGGVWSANPNRLAEKKPLATKVPLRGFLPSPNGSRAVGVFSERTYVGKKESAPTEWLMTFPLDGTDVHRKLIEKAVPVDWSHDGTWVLLQDRSSACIVRATGGQYKCWKGYTAVGIAVDGSFALVLGDRDRDKDKDKKKKDSKKKKSERSDEDSEESSADEQPDGASVPSDADDIAVPLPTGPLALYRTKLEGPYSDPPELIVKNVDGAAVVIPTAP